MRCVTDRPVIGSEEEAQQILAQDQSRQDEPAAAAAVEVEVEAVRCPYCGFWHLVEAGSALKR